MPAPKKNDPAETDKARDPLDEIRAELAAIKALMRRNGWTVKD